jgi:hypothetical protein
MRLKIEDTGSWPKNLTIVMENGTALSKTFANRSYRGWEPLVLQPSMLKENVAELDIELPASVRTTNARTNICFFLDQVLNTCEEFRWGGDLVPTKKRRLWAILVGVALHDDPRLNLSFADNDILDVAGQFVADFEKRNSAGPSDPPDFQEIRLDLILSSRPNQGDAEAKALQQGHPYVTVRQSPTKAEVLRALEEAVADRAKDRELSDDLFLFYFSGHGATIDGKMVLAMPQTRRDLENWRETALISSELLNMLKQIPGQKLVIFDACRSEVPASAELDPNAARTEFEGSVLSAFFFFSGDKGDASIEVPGLTSFNKTRPSGRQGNGLFTYAFLDGLNNKTFARRDERTHRYLIQIDSVVHYLNDEFFGSNNRAVLEQRIPRERRRNGIPIPQVYQARNSNANNKVIRTIEDVP